MSAQVKQEGAMRTYAHMCRDNHPEIGFSFDDDDERCLVCRLGDALTAIIEECPRPTKPYGKRVVEIAKGAIRSAQIVRD